MPRPINKDAYQDCRQKTMDGKGYFIKPIWLKTGKRFIQLVNGKSKIVKGEGDRI